MARFDETDETKEQPLPPFVETKHPISGAPILLHNPALRIIEHKRNTVVCSDAESFSKAVEALSTTGGNRLVELREDGAFVYRDALGDVGINTVAFQLKAAATAGILMLDCTQSFKQKELLQWCAQWPDTLVPIHDHPTVIMEHLAAYKVSGTKNFQAIHGDAVVSMSVEATRGDTGTEIPRFWKATSPLYEGGAAQEVTLRMDVEEPSINGEGKIIGDLIFKFSLWSPAANQVQTAAMEDAAATMAGLLPDFTMIRGQIG